MTRKYYRVEVDEPNADCPCDCEDCGWTGPYSSLAEIGSCALTPGDPSPAGRCPECDTLAYITEAVARADLEKS